MLVPGTVRPCTTEIWIGETCASKVFWGRTERYGTSAASAAPIGAIILVGSAAKIWTAVGRFMAKKQKGCG
jgi:hypothetical protein